jgi:hypothetical protein
MWVIRVFSGDRRKPSVDKIPAISSSRPCASSFVPDGDSAVLLAEFRRWLDRERGLSPVSVRCYSKQSKAFLAGIGGAGAVSELDAGWVPRSWWTGRRAATRGRRRRW